MRRSKLVEESGDTPPIEEPKPDQSNMGEGTALKLDQLKSKVKTPKFVYVLTFLSAIGGFLFGYDTGVISGAMILLRDEFLLNSVWQEAIVSVTVGTAAVLALVGGFLNNKIGRKPVIILASLVFIVGSIFLALASDRYMLLIGRIIVGAGIGKWLFINLTHWGLNKMATILQTTFSYRWLSARLQ